MAYFSESLARNDPEAFRVAVVEHMAETTELGSALWNKSIDNGTVDYDQFILDPNTWVSASKGNGYLSLGTAPMTPHERAKLLYQGEHLAYMDEVSRRLVHELGHGALYVAQNAPHMGALHQLAYDIRGQGSGELGLSALGSHPFYTTRAAKAGEDVAELLAMRAVGEDHLVEYADFLAASQYERVRSSVGLVALGGVEESHMLVQTVEAALYDVLSQ